MNQTYLWLDYYITIYMIRWVVFFFKFKKKGRMDIMFLNCIVVGLIYGYGSQIRTNTTNVIKLHIFHLLSWTPPITHRLHHRLHYHLHQCSRLHHHLHQHSHLYHCLHYHLHQHNHLHHRLHYHLHQHNHLNHRLHYHLHQHSCLHHHLH